MLEATVINEAATQETAEPKQAKKVKSRAGLYGYLFLFAALIGGLLLREQKLVNPQNGFGYWLGIVGGSLMLFLLLYPAGKKSTILRRMGLVKHWFRIHMIIGLVGPLLVLYHCNFSVSAMNSKVALYSMLGVAVSGLIGRYFYTRIHRGLYGKRAGIEDLRAEIADAMSNSRGLAAILPKFIDELHTVSADLMGDKFTRAISMRRSLLWNIKYYVVRARLFLTILRELHGHAVVSDTMRANKKNLQKTANAYAAQQVRLMRQVAQLSFYERLFSLWHIFHLPLFILLVISALVHVLAVHMY
ncbi:MAG: pyridine nucleotide-disulfide oxidoreductase [Gammaproteobacteria bacterium]|nr:pyridine nucleotide-disulfide oxidoreductase [Gammaproteobacteria bacterium]MDH3417268.1 pyridine nucleotide-disulfide oxidoreductase [Gammaproteobacteria bacterium]